jgi:hypothetical protein
MGGELQNLLASKTTRDKQELWQHQQAPALKDSCSIPRILITFLAILIDMSCPGEKMG